MPLRYLIVVLTVACLSLRTTQAAETLPVWTLQSLGQVTVDTSVVRLRDVVKAIGVPSADWDRLGRLVVALVPPDGRRLSLQRQRIAEAFARRIATPATVHWSGSEIIVVEYRQQSDPEPTPQNIPAPSSQPSHVVTASAVQTASAEATSVDGNERDATDPLPQVVVARRTLRRGDIVSPADVQLETQASKHSTAGLVTDVQSIVGQEVKTGLYKGRPIRNEDVGSPILIRRGDLLELSVIGGGIVVRTGAKAMQEGSDGNLIQIETQEPRRRLLARVVGPGAVEILTRPPQVAAE